MRIPHQFSSLFQQSMQLVIHITNTCLQRRQPFRLSFFDLDLLSLSRRRLAAVSSSASSASIARRALSSRSCSSSLLASRPCASLSRALL